MLIKNTRALDYNYHTILMYQCQLTWNIHGIENFKLNHLITKTTFHITRVPPYLISAVINKETSVCVDEKAVCSMLKKTAILYNRENKLSKLCKGFLNRLLKMMLLKRMLSSIY